MNLKTLAQSAFAKKDLLGPRALNPQPLPPKALVGIVKDPIGPRAINPQPLPPKEAASKWQSFGTLFSGPLIGTSIGKTIGGAKNPLDAVALNPQPLPPKTYAMEYMGHFDDVALNPQPLPPKEAAIPLGGPPHPDPEPFSLAKSLAAMFTKFKAVFAI